MRTRVSYGRRKKSNSARKVSLAFLNLALRDHPDDGLEDRGGTVPRFVERGYPTKPIITIPSSIDRNWDGDDIEAGGAEPYLDGLSSQLQPHLIISVVPIPLCTRPPRPESATESNCVTLDVWRQAMM
jgi:hypothetical protein